MSELRVETVTYREAERRRWREGRDDMLLDSAASPFLKRVLAKKHAVRPRRFFGEAFVASHFAHDEGYYSPFKWLTSSAWANSEELEPNDSIEFKRALAKYFPRLAGFQAKAAALAKAVGGPKPVAPDLWLIANGEHRFIEVKLAKDGLADHQIAGLALIATHLQSRMPISVTLVNLDCTEDQFKKYIDQLTA